MNVILNSPFVEPERHYGVGPDHNLDYHEIIEGRRFFHPGDSPTSGQEEDFLVNPIRKEVKEWRKENYPHTTPVTAELLRFWFRNSDRKGVKQIFFAQQEAIETAIWLNEAAEQSESGKRILVRLKEAQKIGEKEAYNFSRVAFKLATGTEKLLVMACHILYHFFNHNHSPQDPRFAGGFVIVSPGLIGKDRLRSLEIDPVMRNSCCYRERFLVPPQWEDQINALNENLLITTYHVFNQKEEEQSPEETGLRISQEKEWKEILSGWNKDKPILIINNEAHHCYHPRNLELRSGDNSYSSQNQTAKVWYRGLLKLNESFSIPWVLDFSGTPYFPRGSGYESYHLFPWVVSDFGLVESLEAGLIKIPFLPEEESFEKWEISLVKELFQHVKIQLLTMSLNLNNPPNLPDVLTRELSQFYHHYQAEYEEKQKRENRPDHSPPVFLIIGNNRATCLEIFRYIAGYESNGKEQKRFPGKYSLFSNYDPTTKEMLPDPPTLLLDIETLERENRIHEDFQVAFEKELKKIRKSYSKLYPHLAGKPVSDAELLREMIGSIGKYGKPGVRVRCVVASSSIPECWGINSATHILALRPFEDSQLLCEQIVGRSLRRKNNFLDKEKKFTPEYAYIIGVPLKIFKEGTTPSMELAGQKKIYPLPERKNKYEIVFPNVVGYRLETIKDQLEVDFSEVEDFEIDAPEYSQFSKRVSSFPPLRGGVIGIQSVMDIRDQELIYLITKEVIRFYFSDEQGKPRFQQFNVLKSIVEEWYFNKVKLLGTQEMEYRRLLYFIEPKEICDHVIQGIRTPREGSKIIFPVLNSYNQFGSTKDVLGHTSKNIFSTTKSHINAVTAESKSWEYEVVKTFEGLKEVESYVKNAFLGFAIPYMAKGTEDKLYYPDFIARCKTRGGKKVNLIIDIIGLQQDKPDKQWYIKNRWLPAINTVKEKYRFPEWRFIEISRDVGEIVYQLTQKIKDL